jgi:hypothetical protein
MRVEDTKVCMPAYHNRMIGSGHCDILKRLSGVRAHGPTGHPTMSFTQLKC